jgi:ABC-type thiamine transport system substrate-binding protein
MIKQEKQRQGNRPMAGKNKRMKELKYIVDTGNQVSWHETLDKAITVYNSWVDFYYNNFKKFGDHEITLSEMNDVIYCTSITKE